MVLRVAAPQPETEPVDVIAVDRALRSLEQLDPDQAKLVELRFFGGLTVEEAADSARRLAHDRQARMGRCESMVVSCADHGRSPGAVSV